MLDAAAGWGASARNWARGGACVAGRGGCLLFVSFECVCLRSIGAGRMSKDTGICGYGKRGLISFDKDRVRLIRVD